MGFAKGIKKIFGGTSSSNKAKPNVAEYPESGGGNHVASQENAMIMSNTVNMATIDTKKAEKAQKKAMRKIAKTKGKNGAKHVSTSFPSSPNSAEIRIPGKPYVPGATKTATALTSSSSSAAAGNVLGESQKAMNGASSPDPTTTASVTTPTMPKSTTTAQSSEGGNGRFFASPVAAAAQNRPQTSDSGGTKYFGDDEENENTTPINGSNGLTQKPLTKQYLTQFAAANATPPQHKSGGYLCSTDTPASSSDFCLSTDVEDEEYNLAKQYYESNALMPERSNSTEEESTLFGSELPVEDSRSPENSSIPKDTSNKGQTSSQLPTFSMDSSHIPMKTFGAKPGAGLFPDSSDSELDGEDMLPSPQSATGQSQKSGPSNVATSTPAQNKHNLEPSDQRSTASRSDIMSPISPLPRHPSHNANRRAKQEGFDDDGFGFQDFVVNAWPDKDVNKSNNIISFDNAFDQDPFAATFASSGNQKSKRKESHHRSRKSGGGSVSSAPAVDPKLGRKGQSSARGSRSVAPASSRSASYRASPSNNHTSDMLDKLERDLREKHAQGRDHRSSSTPSRRHRRNRSNPVSPLVNGPPGTADLTSDEDRKDPDGWLMHEVTDALGPKGDGADIVSLSGRSTRSKADRSVSGRSTKSRSATGRRQPSSRHKHSSGASVASRNSHYSQRSHKSHMSEASKSVANDLMRLEMQLALVGKGDSGSVADLVSAAQSVGGGGGGGGGSIAGGSVRSRRTTRSKSSRASPRSSGSRNRRTVIAPPGKLGLILANKPDGRGTVVSGVRPTSALVEKVSTGDRIIAVDGEDVSHMNVSELTTIMTRKSDFDRKLTILSFPHASSGTGLPHARAR